MRTPAARRGATQKEYSRARASLRTTPIISTSRSSPPPPQGRSRGAARRRRRAAAPPPPAPPPAARGERLFTAAGVKRRRSQLLLHLPQLAESARRRTHRRLARRLGQALLAARCCAGRRDAGCRLSPGRGESGGRQLDLDTSETRPRHVRDMSAKRPPAPPPSGASPAAACSPPAARAGSSPGGHVSDMSRTCLGRVSDMSRTCLGRVSDVSRTCLGHVSDMSRTCLGCLGHVSDVSWKVSRRREGELRSPPVRRGRGGAVSRLYLGDISAISRRPFEEGEEAVQAEGGRRGAVLPAHEVRREPQQRLRGKDPRRVEEGSRGHGQRCAVRCSGGASSGGSHLASSTYRQCSKRVCSIVLRLMRLVASRLAPTSTARRRQA